MAERAELDDRIARLEAALDATAAALRARAAEGGAAAARTQAEADLSKARERIAALEDSLARTRPEKPVPQHAATPATDPTPGADEAEEVATLRAQLAEMRAAREMDLAEMKSLLTELEPMLEAADA